MLRELKRNAGLLRLCGFSPLPLQGKPRWEVVAHPETGAPTVVLRMRPVRSPVPSAWNFFQFLGVLEQAETQTGCVTSMMAALRERLKAALPDFGVHLDCDGKAPESRSTGQVNRKTGTTSDQDADWGRRETHGIDLKTADRRIFTPTPYGSPSWHRGYKRRNALELTPKPA